MSNPIAFKTRITGLDGCLAFEIPMLKDKEGCVRPKLPLENHLNTTYFYTQQCDRLAVVAGDKTSADYLDARQYAEFLGVVEFHSEGIGQYQWEPREVA